jgi:hypothetical protein
MDLGGIRCECMNSGGFGGGGGAMAAFSEHSDEPPGLYCRKFLWQLIDKEESIVCTNKITRF